MKMILTSATVLVLAAGAVQGQQFQRAVGLPQFERGNSIEETTDRGFITAGSTTPTPTAPLNDYYIVRYGYRGVDQWTRVIGSVNQANDVAFSVRETRDSGFIVAGETNSVGPQIGINLTKLDPLGGVTWSNLYTGTPFVDPAGVAVRETPDLGYAVVGRVQSVNQSLAGMFIRTAPAGNPVFQLRYSYTPAGTDQPVNVSFADLRILPDGAVICGWIANPQTQRTDALVMRVNTAGAPIWTRTYVATAFSGRADGIELFSDKAVFSGRVTLGGGQTQSLVARIDLATGDLNWARVVPDFLVGNAAVANDQDRHIVLGGSPATQTFAAMLKMRIDGVFEAERWYGTTGSQSAGNDAIVLDCNRGYALTGWTNMLPNSGQRDLYFVRTDRDLVSGCREAPVTALPFDPQLTVPRIQMAVAAADLFQPWQRFVQQPDSGNFRYCYQEPCVADVDDGTGTGTPDGGVGIEDLLYYLALYGAGSSCADVDDGTGTGAPDGGVGIEDLLFFLDHYNAGC